MDIITLIFDFQDQLGNLISVYGREVYLFLFVLIFLETGLVLTPFLPGDSLLFIVGAFAALGSLNLTWILFILAFAAVLGDSVNYWLGRYAGVKIFDEFRLFNRKHLERTKQFYHIHGQKTIILARFVPIVRTFAPFVAGIGRMEYRRFFTFNVIGGVLWVSLFIIGGYLFGNIPLIKDNLFIVSILIIIISMIPLGIEFIRSKRSN